MVGYGKGPGEASGILQVCPKDERPTYIQSNRAVTFPNGVTATLYNGTEPDQLRGPQHGAAWCDELAKWAYAQEAWDQLEFGMRVGENPRTVITTTPRPLKLLKDILAEPSTVITHGTTTENMANLSAKFIKRVVERYEGTRLGRQELGAEILDDTPGALWSRANIDETRIKPQNVPELSRVVVAIDPAVSTNEDSDETGIVCCGMDKKGDFYVLEDRSDVYRPAEWAAEAIALFRNRGGDRIVGEVNNGGDMIEATLRNVSPGIPFRAVHATRGKAIRAEPISALYEKKKVHHVGQFPRLEDQMCTMTTDFDRTKAKYSPDRMDALVWALTELNSVVIDDDAGGLFGVAKPPQLLW
jgi:phage terminase large subunit-like protein